MDVIVKGSPSIEIGFERKVVDSYKAVDSALSETSKNPVENAAITKALKKNKKETDSALATKANTAGYYPQMSVGFADDLVGRGESVPAEFSFRASGGKSIKDGTARIKRLKGNSVVWNQKVNYHSVSASSNGITAELLADGRVRIYGTATNNVTALNIAYCDSFIVGHKYLLTGPSNVDDKVYVYWYKAGIYNSLGTSIISPTSLKDGYGYVYIRVNSGAVVDWTGDILCHDLTQMFQAGNEPTTIEEFNTRKPIVEDEYAYNEGEVIHCNTESIKSVGDNAFDGVLEQGGLHDTTGTLVVSAQTIRTANYIKVLPNETYHVQFTGSSLFLKGYFYDAELNYVGNSNFDFGASNKEFIVPSNAVFMKFRIYTTSGTITPEQAPEVMITLVHSGWKQDTDAGYQPYWEDRLIFDQRIKDEFPNGMKSAGIAHDVAYNDMNKGVGVTETWIGVVDMGDLDWEYISNDDPFFRVEIPLKREDVKPEQRSQLVCAIYSIGETTYYSSPYKQDKTIYETFTNGNENWIYVKDSAYTDAATFKAAMAGVPLYYELAEPTIIEYDEPFNLDYKVADFGTEQAIAEQPSAPISADIIYQFNAVDMIREHEIEIAELQSIIATMQAQLASLTSNNE